MASESLFVGIVGPDERGLRIHTNLPALFDISPLNEALIGILGQFSLLNNL
jgi:hypothetical protein